VAWTQPLADGSVDGWLALDRNGNRTIDDGSELFGSATPQPPPNAGEIRNGFLALAVYDDPSNGGNANAYIDSGDAVYSTLLVWQDFNHDGRSQPNELIKLSDLGIARIDLVYQTKQFTDESGNVFRYRSRVFDAHGNQNGRWAWDVFLAKAPTDLSLLGQERRQLDIPYGGGR
jgi:hypothetical protein